ncbi:DUF3823 domain-containing protein [Mucilaginibacter sp. X4EP1]|uniref:DUF3823 domain-containing protein n=1 Tax=Mucilaginibacter sp. X4EP1 TaxID=2723092 RepID=UPI002169415F|nr:DUF3823 domain-containing protein [Mucilaginibacter sp. X4EP1]MCS3814639.1 hypothetical protein [Mucilaginibacter sp. X4EP1]
MKKTKLYYIAFGLLVILNSSCSKVDNYPAPSNTIKGSTIDAGTGNTVQTEVGGSGTRVKLLETSYSANPTPYYFQSMQDGTFDNTKIFAATYKISVEGPFVPLVVTDNVGNVVSDESQNVVIKGTNTVTNLAFKVEPFLRVDMVGTPVFNADSTVTVQVKITRGTANPAYQLDITDINLYVSNTLYDGNNNYDPRYSKLTSYSGSTGTSLLGQTISITTVGGALPQQDVYFRVGARINAGLDEYNYSLPLSAKYP